MEVRLKRENLGLLPKTLLGNIKDGASNEVLHFGVGGFHRAHQAYYLQMLYNLSDTSIDSWTISGACILENDRDFVERMVEQDFLYTLKTGSAKGKVKVQLISSISQLYFGPSQAGGILDRMASQRVKVISFTITEGGYMVDGATGAFMLEHPLIQKDLESPSIPYTVFGYLAQGLQKRKERNAGKLILLSCDNIQENGQILKNSLESFLQEYDRELLAYVRENVDFPNSMVDRITPVTTQDDKDRFEREYGYRDECLVVSEDFCQWILERPQGKLFPPVDRVGVKMVDDVRPYEKMKLRILNGGHSLIGFLGKAMGYEFIHQAVMDPLISKIFSAYVEKEVIPSLDVLEDIDYKQYALSVKERFGNESIRDRTDRIISFSSAKIPKFVLPVLEHAQSQEAQGSIASLILAAWWCYLKERSGKNRVEEVEDAVRDDLMECFKRPHGESIREFFGKKEIFGFLGGLPKVQKTIGKHIETIEMKGIEQAMTDSLETYN